MQHGFQQSQKELEVIGIGKMGEGQEESFGFVGILYGRAPVAVLRGWITFRLMIVKAVALLRVLLGSA